MTGSLEHRLESLLSEYVANNGAARTLSSTLTDAGVGLQPVIDHLTLRTRDVDRCAGEYIRLGYRYTETLEYDDWFAKIYRLEGFPALFVDQAFPGERGRSCPIPAWAERFGDQTLHHAAVRVADIELAIRQLSGRGVEFAGAVIGDRGAPLRQIFTVPEIRGGAPFSVLELTERHDGYQGFSPPQANALMRSTVRE